MRQGARIEGRPVAELERATHSRVLLLTDGRAQRWRPPGGTTLRADQELVLVVPRGGLGQVAATTG